ncbi:hypothetical protein O0Z71_07260 [Ligilactobacillus saerimneri]|uniref:hypothetical protein n=1 Tax=Ligilactobacillus saerimneri TaxID=228229 RepID=UPI0022A6C735|nr:hypothetical protein [Ligilactobacillus saerimneri]MCZ0892221.1 hypothetical protein [Ligilactobacillus saerimneri]
MNDQKLINMIVDYVKARSEMPEDDLKKLISLVRKDGTDVALKICTRALESYRKGLTL